MELVIIALFVALGVTWMVTPGVCAFAVRMGVMDQPGARRVHTQPTPRWGGLAIWLGVTAGVVVVALVARLMDGGAVFTRSVWALLGGATLVAAVGMLDDKYNLSAVWQAVALMVIAFLVTRLGVRIDFITNPFHGSDMLHLGALAVPATIVWLFGVTKTIDLVDGLDGLAAGVCAIISLVLVIMATIMHTLGIAVICAAVTGASLGFLRYNYPPAKIFMGTVGAQFMGFLIAGAAVVGAIKVAAIVMLVVLALGVPLGDAFFAVARRAANGKAVYLPDRGHIHHRLLDAGLTQSQAIMVIYALTAVLSTAALVIFIAVK